MLCNIYIKEGERGKGYSNILVAFLSIYSKRTAYAFIRHNNTASIRCFCKSGFVKISNAEYTCLHVVKNNRNGHLGIYVKQKEG